jgi:hypothetical protein
LRANLGQQAGQRGLESRLVTTLDSGFKLGVQVIQPGRGIVFDPELALA